MKTKHLHGHGRDRSKRCLEIINIRLYDAADHHKIMDLFERTATEVHDSRLTLFRNAAMEGDWSIHMWRPVAAHEELKSSEAVCMSELLKEIGLVHHVIWLPENRTSGLE